MARQGSPKPDWLRPALQNPAVMGLMEKEPLKGGSFYFMTLPTIGFFGVRGGISSPSRPEIAALLGQNDQGIHGDRFGS